jgi:glycosyltransferase involved in cell wall biosynthesis
MKLVILLPTLPAYRKDFFESLNYKLQKKEFELTIIHGTSFFNKSIKSDANPNYCAIPLKNFDLMFFGYRIVLWRGLLHNLRKIKPKIIIILFSPGNISLWFTQLYCFLKGINVGIWSSGFIRQEISGIKRKIRTFFLNFFLYRAKFHICYGTKYKNELIKLGIKESKIFVAQNTLNIEKILALEIDSKKNILPDHIIFLFVGALINSKNLDIAIKAIAKLVHEGFKVKFNVIGEGSIINQLKSLVIDEQMENNVFILGPKYDKELSSYFINADIFLLPGTGGLAINEAMAYGLPIISTIGDGTVIDLVYEGKNGFLLNNATSVENIYITCKKALEYNRLQLLEMGTLSRQLISEKASLQNMVSNFETAIIQGMV